MSIEMGILAPHVPHICHESNAPEFQKPLIEGMRKVATFIEKAHADVVVLVSTHWLSTFHHFVDATPIHKGVLTAFECPQVITDVPYYYPGDEELASQLVEAGEKAGLPVVKVNDPTYVWDYGTVVPLRYLVPKENIPVVDLSVTWAGNLEETYYWGQQIGKVLRESEKRVVFVASGALSHNLVRGVENIPTQAEDALNEKFLGYLRDGDFASAKEMLPQFARIAGVEAGGRHLAMLFGVLEGSSYNAQYLGYAQSSGSGNVVMSFHPSESDVIIEDSTLKSLTR
jgi:3,4-dihydroxyphenylacetate 2,3-dioxygenase